MPNAHVRLLQIETNVSHETVSNASGNYSFLNIPPGLYTIECTAPQFKTEKLLSFTLTVNQVFTWNPELTIGSQSVSIDASAEPVSVETSTSELGSVVGERPVNDLPLQGRNFTQLLTLTPGITPISVGQNSGGGESPVVANSSFTFPAVNGQSNRSNSFLTDGMTNQHPWYSTYAVAPIIDDIQEFKVSSHNDAQFGQVTGGVVNVATKAGTNSLHGTAWEYFRNNTLNAKNYFQQNVTPYTQNQFGMTIGGPVRIPKLYDGRDKTFFFGAYEGFHYKQGVSESYFRVPTAAELTGDYDDLYQRLEAANPGTGTLYDPHTGLATPVINGRHNQIQSLLDPGAVAWAKAELPAAQAIPNQTYNNAEIPQTSSQTQWNYSARIDHTFSSRDFVFFRYSAQKLINPTSSSLPGLSTNTVSPTQQYGASWVHIFSPTRSLHLLYSRAHVQNNTASYFANRNLADIYGLNSTMTSFNNGYTLFPDLGVSNYFSGGEQANNTKNVSSVHEVAGNYAMVIGRHQLEAGGSWDQLNYTDSIHNASLGFGTQQTSGPLGVGDASASFLIGFPSSAYKRDVNVTERPGGIMSYYAQDSWKATDHLTINYGLRYDRTFIPAYGKWNTAGQIGGIDTGDFDFTNGTYILQAVPQNCSVTGAAPCIPGNGSLPDHVIVSPNGKILHDTKTNFGARLGLAYSVNNKLVLHLGAGEFYDNWAAALQLTQNYQGSWPDTGTLQTGPINEVPINQGGAYTNPHNPFSGGSVLPGSTPFSNTNSNYFVSPYIRNPESIEYNVGIQQQISSNTILSLNYVGSVSHRLDIGSQYNTGMPSTLPFGSPQRTQQTGLNGPQANGQLYGYTPPVHWDRSAGNGNYNALQASISRPFTHGFAYTISYTWSKAIDEGQSGFIGVEGNDLQDPYNVRGSRGPAAYNIPQLLVINFNYEIPVGKGKQFSTHNRIVDYVVGNWQVNSIFMLRSGQNYTLHASGDIANTGDTDTYARAQVIGNPYLAHRTIAEWFNTAAFTTPTNGNVGNSGRNNMMGQTYSNDDLSIFRVFPIRDKFSAQFRAEAFNIANQVIFGNPGNTVNSPGSFGVISSTANSPRVIQLGIHLFF